MRMSTAPVVFWTLFSLGRLGRFSVCGPCEPGAYLRVDFAFSRFRGSFVLFFQKADCSAASEFDERSRLLTSPSSLSEVQSWDLLRSTEPFRLDRSPGLYQGRCYSISSKDHHDTRQRAADLRRR